MTKNKRECETVAFVLRFHVAKTNGNARGVQFLYVLLNSTENKMFSSTLIFKNGQECKRGACFHLVFQILPNKK